MPRNLIIKVRVTEDERKEWKDKAEAAGLDLSELIRQSLGRVHTWTASDRKAHRERTFQLVRIGNNLTMIAKWVHTYKMTAESVQVLAALIEIEQTVKEFRD